MAALPHMPLYPSDYLADTPHLSTVEHGAYLLLIMSYWAKGDPLPDNDARLARIARLNEVEWLAIRDTIAEFFTIEDGVWLHGRIERELGKARTKVDQARNAGMASAERRSNGRSTGVQRNDDARATNQNQNQNHISPNGENTRKRSKLAKRPDDVEQSTWDDFQALRTKKRAPLTETALKGIAREADKAGYSLNRALTECCERGWQSLKAEWVMNEGNRNGNGAGKPSGWLS